MIKEANSIKPTSNNKVRAIKFINLRIHLKVFEFGSQGCNTIVSSGSLESQKQHFIVDLWF